jgi:hypothetical protein
MRANEFLTELWTQPYELTSRATGPANMEYYFDTKDNRSGRIVFDSFLDTDDGGLHVVLVIVHFYIDNLYHTSGKGDAVAIFSTVVAACRDYLRRYKPPVVTFETPDAKKRNLYVRMTGMFPDYVIYPYLQWVHDPIVGDEIVDSLMDGNANDAVVLRRRDYDPEKTRVYIDEQGPSNDTAISLSKLGKFHPGAGFWDKHRGEDVRVWEAFDNPYKTKSEKSEYGDVDMLAKLPDGTNLSIMFNQEDAENDTWGVEFYRNNSQEVTGEGDAQRVFATVLNAIQKFIKKNKPQKLFFSASKEVEPEQNSESRAKLYDRLVQRYAKAWGYRAFRADTGTLVRYELSRLQQGVA